MQTPKPKKPMFRFSMYWMYAIILVFLLGMLYLDDNSISKEVNYTQFCNIVEKDMRLTSSPLYPM